MSGENENPDDMISPYMVDIQMDIVDMMHHIMMNRMGDDMIDNGTGVDEWERTADGGSTRRVVCRFERVFDDDWKFHDR